MDLPTYFELDGKYAAVIPLPNGSLQVVKDKGYYIADFMRDGRVILFEDLPKYFQQDITETLK